MNATEAVAAIERLVEAGLKATPGEWYFGEGSPDPINNHIIQADPDEQGLYQYPLEPAGRGDFNEEFIVLAANARPALSALAGMCVLPAEVVRALLGMATVESGDDCIAREAAEAELRRVES